MRIRLEITGTQDLAQSIDELARATEKPLGPLLDAIAAEWTGRFQAHILEGGIGGARFAPLATTTLGVRRRRGYDGRPLIRKGDLLHSITTLRSGADFVEVGSAHPTAFINQEGGGEDAEYNFPGSREIPPRPFIGLSAQELGDTIGMIEDYFFEELAA